MVHYHVMLAHELGDERGEFKGLVFESMADAAIHFWNETGRKVAPQKIAELAFVAHWRGLVLRDRTDAGSPWLYLAVCRRRDCDLSTMRYHHRRFGEGSIPNLVLSPVQSALARRLLLIVEPNIPMPVWYVRQQIAKPRPPRFASDREYHNFQDEEGHTVWE